jgi:uncharacterized membrane protein YtjA (UPF0391 family)
LLRASFLLSENSVEISANCAENSGRNRHGCCSGGGGGCRAVPALVPQCELLRPFSYSTMEGLMLRYAAIFFVIAIIAAVFGFGGIAAGAAEIAKVLFFIFIVIFLVTLLMGVVRR